MATVLESAMKAKKPVCRDRSTSMTGQPVEIVAEKPNPSSIEIPQLFVGQSDESVADCREWSDAQDNESVLSNALTLAEGADIGVPGVPGSHDLEVCSFKLSLYFDILASLQAALMRISLRREANRELRRLRRERLSKTFRSIKEPAPAPLLVSTPSPRYLDSAYGSHVVGDDATSPQPQRFLLCQKSVTVLLIYNCGAFSVQV